MILSFISFFVIIIKGIILVSGKNMQSLIVSMMIDQQKIPSPPEAVILGNLISFLWPFFEATYALNRVM